MGEPETGLSSGLSSSQQQARDLAAIVQAWPSLPERVRVTILTLVEASTGTLPEPTSHSKSDRI